MHLLWAPYAPKDTAAAPERPANLTNGEPWITKLLKLKKKKLKQIQKEFEKFSKSQNLPWHISGQDQRF